MGFDKKKTKLWTLFEEGVGVSSTGKLFIEVRYEHVFGGIHLRLLLCLEPIKKSLMLVFDLDLAQQIC